jgi:hypothetical protein
VLLLAGGWGVFTASTSWLLIIRQLHDACTHCTLAVTPAPHTAQRCYINTGKDQALNCPHLISGVEVMPVLEGGDSGDTVLSEIKESDLEVLY